MPNVSEQLLQMYTQEQRDALVAVQQRLLEDPSSLDTRKKGEVVDERKS